MFTIYDPDNPDPDDWTVQTVERTGDLVTLNIGPDHSVDFTVLEAEQLIEAFTALVAEIRENK